MPTRKAIPFVVERKRLDIAGAIRRLDGTAARGTRDDLGRLALQNLRVTTQQIAQGVATARLPTGKQIAAQVTAERRARAEALFAASDPRSIFTNGDPK